MSCRVRGDSHITNISYGMRRFPEHDYYRINTPFAKLTFLLRGEKADAHRSLGFPAKTPATHNNTKDTVDSAPFKAAQAEDDLYSQSTRLALTMDAESIETKRDKTTSFKDTFPTSSAPPSPNAASYRCRVLIRRTRKQVASPSLCASPAPAPVPTFAPFPPRPTVRKQGQQAPRQRRGRYRHGDLTRRHLRRGGGSIAAAAMGLRVLNARCGGGLGSAYTANGRG